MTLICIHDPAYGIVDVGLAYICIFLEDCIHEGKEKIVLTE